MTESTLRRRVVVIALAVLAAAGSTPARALLPADAPFAAPAAAAASSGLTMVADARYVVDPAKRRVIVTVAITATNHHSVTVIRSYYFDHGSLAVLPGTSAFYITDVDSMANLTVRVSSSTRSIRCLRMRHERSSHRSKATASKPSTPSL